MVASGSRRLTRRKVLSTLSTLAATGWLAWGCTSPTTIEPDPDVEPLAGTWEATSVVLTSREDPEVSFDLIEEGGTFLLDIQPSGRYVASLSYRGQTAGEVGRVSVAGNIITLNPDEPGLPTTSGTFELQGVSTLIVDGETEFDFNLDGTTEGAFVHFEFSKS